MTLLVEGFPSQIAALQFEWALQNPHLTLHISEERRLVQSQSAVNSRGFKRPKPPRRTLPSILSNLHLLLRVPSFSRWPLRIRFFSKEVWLAWKDIERKTVQALPEHMGIICEFPAESVTKEKPMHDDGLHPIHRLDVSYGSLTEYVAKTKDIFELEKATACAVCSKIMGLREDDWEHERKHDGPLLVCPHASCTAVSHLRCLGDLFLNQERESGEDEIPLVPTHGTCPSCRADTQWVDVVREATLRMRGQKEIDTLLRRKRAAEKKLDRERNGKKGKTASQVVMDTDESEELSELSDTDEPEGEDEDGFMELEDLGIDPATHSNQLEVRDLDNVAFMDVVTEGAKRKLEKTSTAKSTARSSEAGNASSKSSLSKFTAKPNKRREVDNVIEIPDTDESEDSWSGALELE